MKRYDFLYILCLLALLCGTISSCSEDPLADGLPEENPHGLVLQLAIDGNPVATPSAASTRIAADPTLNENLVEEVDVFFFSNDALHKHVNATLGTDYRIVLAGADWKTQFPDAQYDVYVVANRHEDTDLSGISTVAELMKLIDTDNKVYRVEGERMSELETYSGKTFLMDGKVTWTPPATDDATIEVDLKRAAAKIVVNVSFSEDFITDQIDIISVRKKVVNYVPQAMAFADAGYQEMEVMGDAGASGFAYTDYTNGEQGTDRRDVLYAYTYPNHWGENMERETYLLVNVPYNDNNGTDKTNDDTQYLHNYYKVPIRFSADMDELHLDRNMQYTVNVTIDRKGNTEIDGPVPLNPTFNVAEWKTVDINVDNDSPNYLVLSDYDIEMHNEEEVTIEFFSSSELSSVEILGAYFINKSGKQVDKILVEEGYWPWEEDKYEQIKDLYCSVEYDHGSLTGNIRFTGEIPDNVTARYVTLEVTNTDKDSDGNTSPIKRKVTIVQYPLEYIMGVPGKYSTRDDFKNNTYEAYRDKTYFEEQPDISITFGTTGGGWWPSSYTFYSKVFVSNTIRQVEVDRTGHRLAHSNNEYASGQNNNRMYLVQIKSTNTEYTVARPKTEIEDGQLVAVSSEDNNELVSPAFMLASQLGVISSYNGGGSWSGAKEHCKNYVEVIEYTTPEQDPLQTRILNDWRLPTSAELKIIGEYQDSQPQVMDKVLKGQRYWSALKDTYYTVPNGTTDATGVRCIRDVTPADLEEFADHGIR